MSLERIYYTISPLKKNCKEACGDDKAVQVKKESLKEKPPIGHKGLAVALGITFKVVQSGPYSFTLHVSKA